MADQPHISPDKARERAGAGAGAGTGGTASWGSGAGGLPAPSALLAGKGCEGGCTGGGGGGFPTSRPSAPLPWGYARSPGADVPREGLESTQPVLCAGPTREDLKEGPTGPSAGQTRGHRPKDPTSHLPQPVRPWLGGGQAGGWGSWAPGDDSGRSGQGHTPRSPSSGPAQSGALASAPVGFSP